METLVDGVVGGLLGIILMYFSIQVTNETIVDLRYIPVLLLIVFIGVPPALLSSGIIIFGRFMFGVNTSAYAALVLMVLISLSFVLIDRFIASKKSMYRKSLYMALTASVIFSIIITILINDFSILKWLIPSYWVISIIGGLGSVFLIDYLMKSHSLLMRYKEESSIDFLTGLNNVRQFDTVWNTLVRKAEEKNERLSLLIIDIDFFKRVNDQYGHPAGNRILIELGMVLKNATRSFDVVSRNGGEEFSVIMPGCSRHQAAKIAERIRRDVEKHEFSVSTDKKINITVSIGVATYPETVTEAGEMVECADQALYVAKRSGRNRVCFEG